MYIKFSVTKNGIPLDPSLYTWDEKTKTFSTTEGGLVLDFTGVDGVTFATGKCCTFTTGSWCTFTTGYYCIFTTKGKSSLTYMWNNCYEVYKLDRDDVEYRINLDGSLTITELETEEQRKIRELKETIDKAQQQIEELQKNKQ